MLGIQERLDHRPSELSGGEQQRVAIARALITRPAIVLADEPTGNLDTSNSDAVLEMLRFSNREFNQTVLMITHNEEAAAIGDRILAYARRRDDRPQVGAELVGHRSDRAELDVDRARVDLIQPIYSQSTYAGVAQW